MSQRCHSDVTAMSQNVTDFGKKETKDKKKKQEKEKIKKKRDKIILYKRRGREE